MPVSTHRAFEPLSDPQSLDASVEEVFATMLGLACRREPAPAPASEGESITAVVGFGGAITGACIFSSAAEAARLIAGHMTGSSFATVDDTVRDAIGEICNMLAGAWKARLPTLAAGCGLSIPAIITGSAYGLCMHAATFRLDHVYRFAESTFSVSILCDGLR
jgi:chemotaxis protein CheX